MTAVLAIAGVTMRAAIRSRVAPVLLVLLLLAVAGLPLLLKHNGTARMFTQVSLTYSLLAVTTLLGLATLWLACHSMARDLATGQLQPTLVKPVARWQAWLGKWLGLTALNALLLALAAGGIFATLHLRAARLAPDEQRQLREEVLVARGAVREPMAEFHREVENVLAKRRENPAFAGLAPGQLREVTTAAVRAAFENVAPNHERRWALDLGWRAARLRDEPLFLRVRAFAAREPETGGVPVEWLLGTPEAGRFEQRRMELAPGAVHELRVPAGLVDADGVLRVRCANRSDTTLVFRLEDGPALLFREDAFVVNYARAVLVLWCWLALITALGLSAGAFLSFPVAALFTLTLLLTLASGGAFAESAAEGTVFGVDHETGERVAPGWDRLTLPVARALAVITGWVGGFTPVESLTAGRSVGWGELARAVFQILLTTGAVVALAGVALLHRRELALAQTSADA